MNLELALRVLLSLSTTSLTDLRWFRWVWSKAFTGPSMCHWYHLILEQFLLVGFSALQSLPSRWICIFRYVRQYILGLICSFGLFPCWCDHFFTVGVEWWRNLVAVFRNFFRSRRRLTWLRVFHQFSLQGQHGDLRRNIAVRYRDAWTAFTIDQITDIGVISGSPFRTQTWFLHTEYSSNVALLSSVENTGWVAALWRLKWRWIVKHEDWDRFVWRLHGLLW